MDKEKYDQYKGKDWEREGYQEGNEKVYDEAPEDVAEFEEDNIEVVFQDETYEHRPLRYFEDAGFPAPIMHVIQGLGFKFPTKIQCHSIPVVMNEFDIIGIAKTGSGKTLAFLLPGLCKLMDNIRYCKENNIKFNNREAPSILVLAPTRELAMQIYNSALPFTQKLNLSAAVVYGGTNMGQQIKSVRYVDILIATPGRLIDLLGRQVLRLDQVNYFVLDEADRMLDMGFMPQVEEIMNYLTTDRQNLLWSATWPKEIQALSTKICINEVATIKIGSDDLTVNQDIEQHIEVCEDNEKLGRLFEILKNNQTTETSKNLIFVKTKVWCERLCQILNDKGINAMALHGDKSQNQRDHIVRVFRRSFQSILVATDVASRGLDIKNIGLVINFDFPSTVSDYIHRIGRTGRAGMKGKAYTFFTGSDVSFCRDFIQLLQKANQEVPQELYNLMKKGYSRRSGGGYGGGGYGRYGRGGGGGGSGFGGVLHNFRNNNVKRFDEGHAKSAWNGGEKSSYGGSRYTESERGGNDFGGKVSFFNSKKKDFDEMTPTGDKDGGRGLGFASPVLHNFRQNNKTEDVDMKKYSQTPNPGYEDSSRKISSMADPKKSSLKTNSNPFYQQPGGEKKKAEDYHNDRDDRDDHRGQAYGSTHMESPDSRPSPMQKATPVSTGRQFGGKKPF